MRKLSAVCICASVIGMMVHVAPARADFIAGNLGATVNGYGTVNGSGLALQYAQEFTTGSSAKTLTDIEVALGSASGAFTAGAELVTDNAGTPSSTMLTSITVPTIGSGFSDLTLTPTSSVVLSPNTDYWLILKASGTGTYEWDYTNTLNSALPLFAVSTDNGSTWSSGTGPFLIQVDGTTPAAAVPEPASFNIGLAALSVVGLGLWKKHRSAPHRAEGKAG